MSIPGILDHALFAILALFFPVWSTAFGFRRLQRASEHDLPRVRRSAYRIAIAIQWSLVAFLLAMWIARDRPLAALGLGLAPTPGLWGVLAGAALIAWLVVRQRREAMDDDHALAQVRHRLHAVERLIPRAPDELKGFAWLSVTAGICEEILYRGYLVWYLGFAVGLIPAIAVAALLFGFGHAYQGPKGIAMTAAVGAFFGAVYAVSGTLYPAMALHALMDLHSGHMGYVAFRREAEQAEEEAQERARFDAEGASQEPVPPDPEEGEEPA